MEFESVQKIESHAQLILKWRNDPDTLRMSFHTHPKDWLSFYREFCDEYFNFADLPPLFINRQGKRVAFVRFRPVNHPQGYPRRCCDLSINVAPEARGQGLGAEILKELQPFIRDRGYEDLYAEVKVENNRSRRAFEAAGFTLLDEISKELFATGETSRIVRYLAPLTSSTPSTKKVFIIAEAGSNWRVGTASEDIARAQALVEVAAQAGVDAIKFQTYRPETLYVANAGLSYYLQGAGIEQEMIELFRHLSMPYEMVAKIAQMCKDHHIQFLSTAFSPADFAAVDPFVSRHKIASYEIGHIELLKLAAQSKKPLLISTGAATEEETAWAVRTFLQQGGQDLTLLQCTARYPADPKSLHLKTIPWLQKRFRVAVGLSDHSRHPIYAPVAAVALGATVIEKHFTLANNLPGPDHAFAILPNELKEMVAAIRQTEEMGGKEVKAIDPSEIELRSFARRGIQALRPIKEGELLQEGITIAILRPGVQPLGVHPKYLAEMEGKRARRDISLGQGIQLGDWL